LGDVHSWAMTEKSVQRLAHGWNVRGLNPGRGEFSAPIQSGPGEQPTFYKKGTGSLSWGKVATAWCWPPTPSSAEVKERVQLYLYSPSRLSWP